MSLSQWREWQAWREIRGPIGFDRWDFYASFIAMNAGGPYENPKSVTLGNFPMPWADDAERQAKAVPPEKK